MAGQKESLSEFEHEVEANQHYAASVLTQHLSNIDSQEVKYRQFELDFCDGLQPGLPENEVVDRFVEKALKVEFGPEFSANTGFPRLKRIVSSAVWQAQEVKNEILTYSTRVLKERLGLSGKVPQ